MKEAIKQKLLLSVLASSCMMLAASIAMSFAWFNSSFKQFGIEGGMNGSVLESYFDKKERGSNFDPDAEPGSEENPFVITAPKHWENLVKLYHMRDENGNRVLTDDHYFEVGKQYEDDGPYLVSSYDDTGAYLSDTTTVLNLGGLSNLEPIGSFAYPFNSTLEGHGITVSNFTVTPSADGTNGYNDVGIFGYANENASVSNMYWDNFTIDTSGISISEDIKHTADGITAHDDNARIGYIAGHIIDSSKFTNCYVNNCQIKSPANAINQISNYGYYGLVERDSLGGEYGKGSDYEFALDSKACYDYFNSNYNSIKNEQLVLRNTEETGLNQSIRVGGNDPVPFSNVMNTGTIGTYVMDSNDRTVSLSTMGYVSGPRTTQEFEYDLKYAQTFPTSSSSYNDMSSDAELSDLTYDKQDKTGNFINYNSNTSTWEYYHSENREMNNSNDSFDLTISFEKYTKSLGTAGSLFSNVTNISLSGKLYVDKQSAKTLNCSGTATGNWGNRKIDLSCNSVTVSNLPCGTHYIAAIFCLKYRFVSTDYTRYYAIPGTINNNKVTQAALSPSYVLHTNGSITADVSYNLNGMSGDGNGETEITIGTTQNYVAATGKTILICEATYKGEIYYVTDNGQKVKLQSTSDNDYSNADIYYDGSKWKTKVFQVSLDTSDPSKIKERFIGDEQEIYDSGYRSKNLDVVGNGTNFYRTTVFGTDIRIIRLEAENTSSYVVRSITASDIGKPFYSTTYAQDSIVLYIKNTSNAAAHRNDQLGEIEFKYVDALNLAAKPSFKKGNGNFIELASAGEGATSSSSGLSTTVSLTLRETNVQNCSYCCLDKDGNILGTFNSDGSYGVGLDDSKLSKIYTYVMLMGGKGNLASWISRIDFSFKAEDGYGGTFGSVGYRSSPDTLTETVLNFYLIMEDDSTTFLIKVSYASDTSSYNITIKCSKDLKINVFNYHSDTYTVTINGSIDVGSSYSGTITANGYTYPNNP